MTLLITYNHNKKDVVIYVSTKEEFLSINEKPDRNYVLTSDIDFENEVYSFVIDKEFSGSIEGNGYSLSNFTLESKDEYDSTAIFKSINNATIQNIEINDFNINFSKGRVDIICRTCKNSEITNNNIVVSITNESIIDSDILIDGIGSGNNLTIDSNKISMGVALSDYTKDEVNIRGIGFNLSNSRILNNHIDIDVTYNTISNNQYVMINGISSYLGSTDKETNVEHNMVSLNINITNTSNNTDNTTITISNLFNYVDSGSDIVTIKENISINDIVLSNFNKSDVSISKFIQSITSKDEWTYSKNIVFGGSNINQENIDSTTCTTIDIYAYSDQINDCYNLVDSNYIKTTNFFTEIGLNLSEEDWIFLHAQLN